MKTMSCKQLGGACDMQFHADTFEDMAEQSKKHGVAMKDDPAHQDAMAKMRAMDPAKMNQWFSLKRSEFNGL